MLIPVSKPVFGRYQWVLERNRHSEIARVRGLVSRLGTAWRSAPGPAASLIGSSRGRLNSRPRQPPERRAEDREPDVRRRSVRAMAKRLHGPGVSRCCGTVCAGRTCTPSVRSAPGSALRRRLSALPAACGPLLAVQVATARADAPQSPVTSAVPTIAVQVNVQGGIVDISVPGVDVAVSVSVSSQDSLTGTNADPSAAQQPTTQNDGSSTCCNAGAKQVAPADESVKQTRVQRTAPPKRLARRTIRSANGSRARTIRVLPVDRSTRLLAANQFPEVTSERRGTPSKARRGCSAWAGRYERAEMRSAVRPEEHVRDNRLSSNWECWARASTWRAWRAGSPRQG